MNLKLLATILGLSVPGLAFATGVGVIGTVQDVTAENMPSYVAFSHSGQPWNCQPPYSYFEFDGNGNPDTVKAVYAMLIAAVVSGKSVWVYYDDSNPCHVTQVHMPQ
jgi:hypothetical protein